MTPKQVVLMKRDVCAAVDKLYDVTNEYGPLDPDTISLDAPLSPENLRRLAATASSMVVARFCAYVDQLAADDEQALRKLIDVELRYRSILADLESDDTDILEVGPELN